MPIPSPHPFAQPSPFLTIRVHDLASQPGLVGLCADYESGRWRCDELARHMIEWLPEFALTHSEIASLGPANAVRLVGKAAKALYTSQNISRRGEPGELLLHIALRQVFNTIPAISKLYFKDARNDTVKGFDAVHVVADQSQLELWLGEAKFYDDANAAIAKVLLDLPAHTGANYLRDEFAAITNKIDDNWPHADRLRLLLDKNTPLNRIFDHMRIPIFITYDSPVIAEHSSSINGFATAYENEIRKHYEKLTENLLPPISFHFLVLPLKKKSELLQTFDERLRSCQTLD